MKAANHLKTVGGCLKRLDHLNWLQASESEIMQKGAGTTVKGIRLEHLKSIEFNLLPQVTQQAYANTLEQIDSSILNMKQHLAELFKVNIELLNNIFADPHV